MDKRILRCDDKECKKEETMPHNKPIRKWIKLVRDDGTASWDICAESWEDFTARYGEGTKA